MGQQPQGARLGPQTGCPLDLGANALCVLRDWGEGRQVRGRPARRADSREPRSSLEGWGRVRGRLLGPGPRPPVCWETPSACGEGSSRPAPENPGPGSEPEAREGVLFPASGGHAGWSSAEGVPLLSLKWGRFLRPSHPPPARGSAAAASGPALPVAAAPGAGRVPGVSPRAAAYFLFIMNNVSGKRDIMHFVGTHFAAYISP